MPEDRAAVTMDYLALKAVTLRLQELEAGLWQEPPAWRDQTIPRIEQLKERQRALEARLNRLEIEDQDHESSGAEEIFSVVENALFFILPDLVKIERR